MDGSWLVDGPMAVILAICVVTDVKSRLIYNKVIFPGFAAALILQTVLNGADGLLEAVFGFAAGMALLLIPYLTGGMGAGDVKLLGLVGAFKGAGFVLIAGVYMALIGAAMALFALLARRGSLSRIRWTAYYIAGLRYGVALPTDLRSTFSSVGYPYGVAIAGGAICALYF